MNSDQKTVLGMLLTGCVLWVGYLGLIFWQERKKRREAARRDYEVLTKPREDA